MYDGTLQFWEIVLYKISARIIKIKSLFTRIGLSFMGVNLTLESALLLVACQLSGHQSRKLTLPANKTLTFRSEPVIEDNVKIRPQKGGRVLKINKYAYIHQNIFF